MSRTASAGQFLFIDLKSRKSQLLQLRGAPWDVVLSPDGARAYVSVSQLDKVVVVDIAKREVIGSMPTGRRPRALAITPDGATVVSGNMTDGSISYLDTASMTTRARRLVEQELATAQSSPQREIIAARRLIAELALQLAAKGEIELSASLEDAQAE